MNDKNNSTKKSKEEKSGFTRKVSDASKKVGDASKMVVGYMAVRAADELTKIIVKPPEKEKNESRREYVKSKPTKTFVKAAKRAKFWEDHPENIPVEEEDHEHVKSVPGYQFVFNKVMRNVSGDDRSKQSEKGSSFFEYNYRHEKRKHPHSTDLPSMGLISFALVLVPFTILLGFLYVSFNINEFLLLWLLMLYILFFAIPGAYIGLDGVYYGSKAILEAGGETIKFGIKGIYFAMKLFIQAIFELIVYTVTFLIENLASTWVLIVTYILSAGSLYYLFAEILVVDMTFFPLLMLCLIPALLPASIFHQIWNQFLFNRMKEKRYVY